MRGERLPSDNKTTNMEQKITGSEALLKALIAEGVDTIFGYPGGQAIPIYDSLYDYRDQLKHILVRHEQGATHAAQGYARVSGKVGVTVVTSGPGATNTITGIADALMDSTPMVVIAGQVPFGENEPDFNPDTVFAPKDQKKNDKFIMYGMAAAGDALKDAGWDAETASEEEKDRAGVMMGAGIGGLQGIYENAVSFNEFGMKKISPFFIPSVLINLISGNVSIRYGLKGPNHACVTACSTGTHRRCSGDDCARRCRHDGGRRCRICGKRFGAGRFCPDEGNYFRL